MDIQPPLYRILLRAGARTGDHRTREVDGERAYVRPRHVVVAAGCAAVRHAAAERVFEERQELERQQRETLEQVVAELQAQLEQVQADGAAERQRLQEEMARLKVQLASQAHAAPPKPVRGGGGLLGKAQAFFEEANEMGKAQAYVLNAQREDKGILPPIAGAAEADAPVAAAVEEVVLAEQVVVAPARRSAGRAATAGQAAKAGTAAAHHARAYNNDNACVAANTVPIHNTTTERKGRKKGGGSR